MDERLVYVPDPADDEKTILRQETIITVKGVPLTSYMENYLLNSISKNSFKVRPECDLFDGFSYQELDFIVSISAVTI